MTVSVARSPPRLAAAWRVVAPYLAGHVRPPGTGGTKGVGVRAEWMAGIALPGTFPPAGYADLTFAGESRVHQRPGPTSDREPGTAPAFKTQARRRARKHRCHGRG